MENSFVNASELEIRLLSLLRGSDKLEKSPLIIDIVIIIRSERRARAILADGLAEQLPHGVWEAFTITANKLR